MSRKKKNEMSKSTWKNTGSTHRQQLGYDTVVEYEKARRDFSRGHRFSVLYTMDGRVYERICAYGA